RAGNLPGSPVVPRLGDTGTVGVRRTVLLVVAALLLFWNGGAPSPLLPGLVTRLAWRPRARVPVIRETSLLQVRSLQIVYALGGSESARAARAIAACVEPLGARQRGIERCLRTRLGPLHRGGSRLSIKLRPNRLRR